MQYLVGIGFFFAVGGLNAMLIRTELLSPNHHVFRSQPVPDAGRDARGADDGDDHLGHPRAVRQLVRAADDRLAPNGLPADRVVHLLAADGGRRGAASPPSSLAASRPAGPDMRPLGDQGIVGYDAYIGFFALVGISMCLLGFNLLATIIIMRAPGMTWSRLPIFVWGVVATAILMMLAAPMLIATLLMAALDRTAQTAFFIPGNGGSGLPLREPVLGLRPSRGVHRRAARFRDRARAVAGVHAQAAVGLPDRGRRHAGRLAAQLLRLAAPPVRERHQRRPAAVLHALDRAHLAAHRLHLPVRDGHDLARANTVHACRCGSASDGCSTSSSAASPASSCPTSPAT